MSEIKPPFYVEDIFVGKTFNDFSLDDQLGVVKHRSDVVDLTTNFSSNIQLNLPIVAANMDTITGPAMCIAMAQEGGMGILHRNVSVVLQAEWVRQVKRAENLVIENPYCILETKTIGQARMQMVQRKIHTLLVVNAAEELTGLVTKNGLSLFGENELVLDRMKKVMGGELVFSKRIITTTEEAKEEIIRLGVSKLPLIDGKFKIRGLITRKDISKLAKNSWANKDAKGRLRVGAAIGATGDFLERAAALIEAGVDVIVIDIAHGFSMVMKEAVESFQKKFQHELVCGNVANYKGAAFLQDLGVDGIKVGLGSGYGCRTRLETAVGVPQVQAVRAAFHATALPIISDGGVRQNGHIAMALILGASSVMVGSLLAGTNETPGEVIPNPTGGAGHKVYRGMTSPEAKLEQVESADQIKNIEGQSREVLYTGKSVKEILRRIRHNLQSTVSYAGEKTLNDAIKKISENPTDYLIPPSPAAQEESFKR